MAAPPAATTPTHPLRSWRNVIASSEMWLDQHPWIICGVLYVVALGLRSLYLHGFQTGRIVQVPLMDEAYYQSEAWNLVRGAPPASDVYFMTPLYPWFLSVIFRIFGDAPLAPAIIQSILGACAAPLTYLLGRRALRPAWAVVVGLTVAAFAPLVFFEALLLVESLILLALLGAVVLVVLKPGGVWGTAAAGAGLGIAVLGRGSNLVLALPFMVWLWLGGRSGERSHRRRQLVVFVVALGALVAPLVARNIMRAGKPFLLTANAGFNFYVGNGPQATGIFVRIPGLDLQQDPLTLRYVQRQLHHPVTASQTNEYWTGRTWYCIEEDPVRAIRLFGWKLLLFWNRMSIPQVEGFEAAAQGTVLEHAPYWRSFIFLPFALAATWFALAGAVRRARRHESNGRDRVRTFLAVVAIVYGTSIAVFFVTDRYRVPILPILLVLATCGVEGVLGAFAAGRRRWLPAIALVITTAFVLTDPAMLGVDRRRMQRDLHVHAALRAGRAGHFDAAVDEYGAARRLDPHDSDTRDGLARMLGRAGRDSLGLQEFRSLLHDDPANAAAWYNYGNALRRLGRHRAALEAYQVSTRLEADREAAWNQMGESYRALGDTASAAQSYRTALAIVPGYEQALNNLATLRASQGDGVAAERGWRAALAANPRYLPALVNLAILLGDSGRRAESLTMWKQALAVAPGNSNIRHMVGELDPTFVLPPVPRSSMEDSK